MAPLQGLYKRRPSRESRILFGMALCQKFGRLLIGADARFFARTDITNFSTSLNQSPAPTPIPSRLPSGYNAPKPFALFMKDQMTGKSGGVSVLLKIVSTNWKSLGEEEKQNYSERAKKIGVELRDNFEKLTDGQKKDLWDKHVEKMNKRRRLQMKRKLHKFYAETNRPKRPLSSYMVFVKERFEKQTEPLKTRDKVNKFGVEMGQQWRQMTDAEKQPYVDQAQGHRAEYRVELAEWKQNHADEIKAWKKATAKPALKGERQKKVLKRGLKPKKMKAAKALKKGKKQKKTKEVKAEGSVEKEEWSDDDNEETIQQEKRQKKVQKRGRKPKKTESESYVENAAPKMTET
uniref:HMG box domain-containing protein n=1 Tax=Globodera pallida TaxID=36090 RepID=A0A183C027_GLOPA